MKFLGPLPLPTLSLLLVITVVHSWFYKRADVIEESKERQLRETSRLRQLSQAHPCYNITANKTVTSPEGEKILCLVPSEEELLQSLKETGGFNRHYVATTAEEVKNNFEDPFNPIVQSQVSRLNVTGRRRRYVLDLNYKTGTSSGTSKKRSQIAGLRSCVSLGERNSMGLLQLCQECWWVTLLPENKFPRYINERICGQDGTTVTPPIGFCNSGNGQCVQRSVTQDFLVRTNRYERVPSPDSRYSVAYKQVWEPFAQPIRSCCQCQNFS
ncbi:hypothetical protein P5673_023597 [Acropora cervicornis]|uniref:Uncharacterized protein n=1 Tax=Acropora cervicornis TaxID=6130 RepID=A0AAD9Q5V6_ACRCE|nr:hypothetical protein P5673_023597 [Acropora cervicornis]